MDTISQIAQTNQIFSVIAVFLPFVFALLLIFFRLALVPVSKIVLNNGLILINFISLIIFSLLFYFEETFLFEINVYGLKIDENNIKLLLFTSLTYFLLSIFLKKYFQKRKQFLFTKQRFYAFLSVLIFNTYLYLTSINLFQMMIFWIIQSVIIFLFSYFDIFKKSVNFNILRFLRITLIGDFAFLLLCFILFKYAAYSNGYIDSTLLNLEELSSIYTFTLGITTGWDNFLIAACICLALFSRFFVFPFSCYYSFFLNSSIPLYLAVFTSSNIVFALYLFLNTQDLLKLFNLDKYFVAILLINVILNLLSILFEKNLKVIFGYLFSIISSVFIFFTLKDDIDLYLDIFLIVCIALYLIVFILFSFNKLTFKRAIINVNSGFALEKAHIFFFETLPDKLNNVSEKANLFFNNAFVYINSAISSFLTYLINKINTKKPNQNTACIFIIFGLTAIFAVILTLLFERGING